MPPTVSELLPPGLLPPDLRDPLLTAAGAAALADSVRWATHRSDPYGWSPEAWRYVLANVAACPLSPEALAALAAASVRLEALLAAIHAMDAAAEALADRLEAMGPAGEAGA